MLILGFNETAGLCAMPSSVHWYSCVLRRGDGHVLLRASQSEVEVQWRKGRLKRTWKKQLIEKRMKAGLR